MMGCAPHPFNVLSSFGCQHTAPNISYTGGEMQMRAPNLKTSSHFMEPQWVKDGILLAWVDKPDSDIWLSHQRNGGSVR